jgi:hypothetical protein
LDAYHYFGTDDLYLGYLIRFLKPGAQIGSVVPGLAHGFQAGLPEHLPPYWKWEFHSFHSSSATPGATWASPGSSLAES